MATMSLSNVVGLLNLLEQHGIDVWLNGGWGVDALLGHQTREHQDLDITISAADRPAYASVMEAAGFTLYRVDNDFNWVLTDSQGHLVDAHLVDFSETLLTVDGVRRYGPAGLPFEVGSLEGRGTIAGKPVRCESAEFQVRGHTRYLPDEEDYRDVLALCRAFDLEIPAVFERLGFHR